ncbi:MAG: BNR repeat-containing protein [Kiritimatiellae bacterium]|jgi:hypothetical protein|nr:BNR repeat-containing protein [Kiritimatiellia bacterium]
MPRAYHSRPRIAVVSATLLLGISLKLIAESPHEKELEQNMIYDSVVDPAALNLPKGPYGTSFNGQTFQQEAVLTFNGYQYATYYADGGAVCLARRKLDDGSWHSIRFEDYRMTSDDVHRVVVLGICEGDGTIHLSYDHHDSILHYRKSVPGLALRPDEFEWSVKSFGQTTSTLAGKQLNKVTYPQFFSTPTGDLQLIYRLGGSGRGDWYLAEYSAAAGEWDILGMLFTQEGQYKTSESRCAYPNPVRYDPDGRLHITWCWRERPSSGIRDLRTNHDICYAWSDDYGRTWKDNDGNLVAAIGTTPTGIPESIGINTPGIVVRPTLYLWGQMNTTTQHIDPAGRVHVVNWQNRQDAEKYNTDLNSWIYYHYWRGTDGTWHTNKLPFQGRKPQIVVDENGNAYVLYGESDNLDYHGVDQGWNMVLMTATVKGEWKDWRRLWTSTKQFVGEPLIDPVRWQTKGIISVYAQEKPKTAGDPSALNVCDIHVAGSAQK